RTHGQRFSDNPNEKFLLMILGSQAKLENGNRGINVRRGLRTRCEMGWRPGTAPTGYLNEKIMDRKCQVIVDPQRGPVIKKMFEKVAHEHWSGRKVYHWLKFDLNFHTTGNKPLALGNVYRTLSNPFYYGVFEYPRNSGNWYQGKHEPLISKEIFDKVQEQLKRDGIQRTAHEFAFTKLMVCGACGSGVSAEEKYKPLKDGTTKRYVYYGCGRSRDHQCKGNKYLREEELVRQLLELLDRIDVSQFAIRARFEDELRRFNKFQRSVLGGRATQGKDADIDIKTYARYILQEGANEEKRELMGCFKSKLKVTKGVVTVE
ncbi:MAG: recombinase family protein, partial [Minisyncoccia bacterium]